MQVHFRGLSDELAVAGLSTYLLGMRFYLIQLIDLE